LLSGIGPGVSDFRIIRLGYGFRYPTLSDRTAMPPYDPDFQILYSTTRIRFLLIRFLGLIRLGWRVGVFNLADDRIGARMKGGCYLMEFCCIWVLLLERVVELRVVDVLGVGLVLWENKYVTYRF
jgi:hypothetical protein